MRIWEDKMGIITKFSRQTLIILFLSQVICTPVFAAPLLIAVEDDAAPWSHADGTGFANDIVRAAFKASGVEVELTVVPYSRCKYMALKGRAAACFSMSWLPEFAGKIVFAEKPLFLCYAEYFFNTKKPLKAKEEKNLPKGAVVGIVSGYEYPPAVYTLKDKGILILEESESEELNLKKLSLGRIDAALVNTNETKPAELLLAKSGTVGKVKLAFRSGSLASFIGFSMKHPEGMNALKQFNKGYKIISDNGTRGEIEKKWRDIALKEATNHSVNTPDSLQEK
jgi:ABC-type amino acid transport substrate-binding protein